MQTIRIVILLILILLAIFLIPPFHWSIIAGFIFLCAVLGGTIALQTCARIPRLAQKKRRIGMVSAVLLFLLLALQALQVLTILNIIIVIVLCSTLLAL